LGYQLNGLNRFLEEDEECKEHIKIILIDNATLDKTNNDINKFLKGLSDNKRYIIIATMSDIFDSLLKNIGHKLKNKSYRKMVKIIGTLASQSERYKNYEGYENVIRLSPPDFDEARKATSNIVTKLISSFCPYPNFTSDDTSLANEIHFKLYELNTDKSSSDIFKETALEFKKEEIEELIYKPKMNYINGFIYMSLEFVHEINEEWDINLLSLKEKLFHNKDRNDRDITGVKILSTGDSINHFKVKKLKLYNS